ncbi:MAG TPA: sulfatase [Gemmataceae bacterium]
MRATGTLLLLPLLAAPAAAADPRPNVLFCIADDWSWPHAGAYGDPVVRTPNFDRLAAEGVLFRRAYCAAPTCTASRAGILTGQAVHRLAEGANLHGFLPARFPVYPDLLEKAGYVVGHAGKGWGPGNFKPGGRERNPAGPRFRDFAEFLKTVPPDKPFCFWFGSTDPHRPYALGSGKEAGMDPAKVELPGHFPDRPEVRSDVLDYYAEVQRFDRQVGEHLKQLAESGRAANTIVVVSSDNGMPFPRCKANLYDCGTHMPLVIRWPGKAKPGRTSGAFVSLTDLAPTFLDAAGLQPPAEMTGRSLVPLLTGEGEPRGREWVFVERERHAYCREGNLSYPARAIRTREFLYLRNFRPDRWPAGDPEHVFSVGAFGDIDNGPTKSAIMRLRDAEGKDRVYFDLSMGKRPAEELYDCRKDPGQLTNVADDPAYAEIKASLRNELRAWMMRTGDPRAAEGGGDDRWDQYPYYGRSAKK